MTKVTLAGLPEKIFITKKFPGDPLPTTMGADSGPAPGRGRFLFFQFFKGVS